MSLVRFDDVSLEFGDQKLLHQADFSIEPGERICLIGRNGAGKSSLMKLITGALHPDHGEIQRQSAICISQLEQELPEAMEHTVHDHVAEGLAAMRELRREFERHSQQDLDERGLKELEELQHHLEAHGGWDIEQRVEKVLSDLSLPGEKRLSQLSGGWRRRVALGRALVSNPELLLLDEPTNHLDLSTIQWLESRVRSFPGSVLFITHDRAFLQQLATRIVEIDRGKLVSWPGNYKNYLRLKEKALDEEATANALFDKKLAGEETWIRQGIKARRTRNEGRVRALEAMRDEYSQRVKPQAKARVHIESAEQSGRKVVQARNLTYGYGDDRLIDGLSIKIMRGDRIGIVGNNGVGKSTLLRLLLGELEPQAGTLKLGTNLETGYFDQLRRTLDTDKTIVEYVGDGTDYIKINGKERHVIGYLKGFLFSPKRAMTPIKALSGGERNRVILAKILTRPTNLLVLDEPTNDLDVETLEVLEERLCEYQGTLIVVSHDRAFLDNVVTSIFVFEAGGNIEHYVGSYSDWLRRGKALAEYDDPSRKGGKAAVDTTQPDTTAKPKPGKLSYKLQRELDQLPSTIEALEARIASLHETTADTGFYDQDYETVQETLADLTQTQDTLDRAIERWTELEDMQAGMIPAE